MMRFTGLLDVETRLLYVVETLSARIASTVRPLFEEDPTCRHLVGQLLLNYCTNVTIRKRENKHRRQMIQLA